jgi:ubiquinol-cytochrome c reductase cytochrome b subunit
MVMFFNPDMGGYFLEQNNFFPADPLKTPEHIAPVWYFTPYYAILRAFPSKVGGVIAMVLAVMFFFFLPWLDRSPVKSIRYRGWKYRTALMAFAVSFVILGWLGMQVATPAYSWMAKFFTLIYFLFFVLMPFYTSTDNDRPVPERVKYP